MYFKNGDTVLYEIGKEDLTKKTQLGNNATTFKYYPVDYVIVADESEGHELIGVVKGVVQVCLERGLKFDLTSPKSGTPKPAACKQETFINKCANTKKATMAEFQEAKAVRYLDIQRYKAASVAIMGLPDLATVTYEAGCIVCDCCNCVLRRQQDFLEQVSGIEEAYSIYNREHGTKHFCLFLPKFHPELNFIERIWGRMKWYIRKHCDNKFDTMVLHITASLSSENLPLATIRRFARTTFAYLYAYKSGMGIITAHNWVKRHRSHRGHSQQMDRTLEIMLDGELEGLYYPRGRPCQSQAPAIVTGTVEADDDILEELRDDIDGLPSFNHAPDSFELLYDSDLDLLLDDDVAGNEE